MLGAWIEREIAARLVTEFGHAPLEGSIMRRPSRQDARVANAEHLRLLRARRERPRSRPAAERDQQFPPSDGDCHTPLPREVRKWNDSTP